MQITINAPIVISSTGAEQPTINGYAIDVANAPELTGTEKQVAWANAIRTAAIEDMARTGLTKIKDADGIALAKAEWRTDAWQAALDSLNSRLAGHAERLAKITSAKAWIDAANGSKTSATIIALLR